MPLLTNLEMVQDILSSMDSDGITSINDTIEAGQVQDIIRSAYYEILSRRDWEFMERVQQLESVSDVTQPTKIKIPDKLNRINCFRYRIDTTGETRHQWRDVKYEAPCDFLDRVQRRDNTKASVTQYVTDDLVTLNIITDKPPMYWTSFDNKFIYTDAYDAAVESNLQQSRSSITAVLEPDFILGDATVQDLPTNMFELLLNEAKSIAHLQLKQVPNPKAEGAARRQFARLREQEDKLNVSRQYVSYGRKPT